MAEFKDTIDILNRMHSTYERNCMLCPMEGYNISQCRKLMTEDPGKCEQIIQDWGKSHPPRMKWVDWLTKMGILEEQPTDISRSIYSFNIKFEFNDYVPDAIVAASKELISP